MAINDSDKEKTDNYDEGYEEGYSNGYSEGKQELQPEINRLWRMVHNSEDEKQRLEYELSDWKDKYYFLESQMNSKVSDLEYRLNNIRIENGGDRWF